MKAKSKDDGPVQIKSRFGAIPGDELLHRKLVISSRMRRTEAVEYRGLCLIQIWELQNDFAAGGPSVSFAHMSGLHAAGMHKINPSQKLWPSKSALAIYLALVEKRSIKLARISD